MLAVICSFGDEGAVKGDLFSVQLAYRVWLPRAEVESHRVPSLVGAESHRVPILVGAELHRVPILVEAELHRFPPALYAQVRGRRLGNRGCRLGNHGCRLGSLGDHYYSRPYRTRCSNHRVCS